MKDLIERQAAIDALGHMMDTDGFRDGWAVSRANVDCMLRALPSAQPEPCNDAVSRAEAIRICEERGHDNSAYYIEQLPSAEPEIIYCGECAKMKVDTVFHDCWCGETGKKVWVNHYCGYAERRTDEGD